MPADSVKKIINQVEEITDFKVSVSSDASIQTSANMKVATSDNPFHIILINPKFDRASNYLVAVQCLMLLEKWETNGQVTDFILVDDKINYFIDKMAKKIKSKQIPETSKKQFASQIVIGLLQQLNSFPCEIFAATKCFQRYPLLKEEQMYIIQEEIKENLQALSPQIKSIVPEDIFENNATMNSAFASWWEELSGEEGITIPFKAMGYLGKGKKLIDIAKNILDDNSSNKYQKAVDLWAEELFLKNYYKWQHR